MGLYLYLYFGQTIDSKFESLCSEWRIMGKSKIVTMHASATGQTLPELPAIS